MLYYARRIRVLSFDIEEISICSDINPDVLFSVLNRINKAAGFRSLRTLKIFDNSGLGATFKFPISAPNFETLGFYVDTSPELQVSAAAFLYTISSESQNLESLILGTEAMWTNTIVDVLPCFRKLQHLHIQGMDRQNPTDFLKNCALSLTSLQSLMVAFHDFGYPASTEVSRNLSLITFDLLSDLNLTGQFRDIENMLNILHVPKLDTLTLVFQCGFGDQIITDIGPSVERFLTSNGQYLKDGLRTLSLRTNSAGFSFEGYPNSFKAFTKLDSLHVGTSDFHISTSSLAKFLQENKIWSDLTAIHLESTCTNSNRVNDSLSIAVLPLLADTFPKLRHIVIAIYNPDRAAIKTVTMNATRTPHGLETLRFTRPLPQDWISLTSAVTIGSFLCRLFPKLKKVECYEKSEWINEVQGMLKKERDVL